MQQGAKYQLLYGKKRLGMFIHWGIYAIPACHEQHLMRLRARREDYEQLMHSFNPEHYDPEEWVKLAKSAGMEYICFTTKHHDGFCMWDTKQTDYNVMNTPYGKDVLLQLRQACDKHGMDLALYYSIPDWHHKNAYNPLSTHQIPPRPDDEPDMKLYREYVKAQVKELLTGYGKICGFFWDIPPRIYDPEINELVRSLQPGIRINDRGFDEGDYSTPEREVPEGYFTGLTEACESVGQKAWGYRSNEDYYTGRVLSSNIDAILTMGGNYLLNVGPMADGRIPEQAVQIIEQVGAWYRAAKESYVGTEPVRVAKGQKYRLTAKESTLYVHFDKGLECSGIVLEPLRFLPREASVLGYEHPIKVALDIIPDNPEKPDALEGKLHLYDLPAEQWAGYPMILKLVFERGEIEIVKKLLGSREAVEEKLTAGDK